MRRPAFLAAFAVTINYPPYLNLEDEPAPIGGDTLLLPAGSWLHARGEATVLLGTARRAPGVPKTARCECGAPLLWGSRFCATCGRPVGNAAANAR